MLDDATGTIAAPSVGADGGGTGSPESSASPTGEEEQLGAPGEGADAPGPEGEQEPGAETETTTDGKSATEEDGRVLPKWIRSLKETDPEGFKKAKGEFFDLRERRVDFPTVAEARKAKQTLELVGGEAGLAEMQEDNAEFAKVAKQFVNGDPAFSEDLFAQDPIAAAQHVPSMLESLSKHDKQAYNRLIAKQFVGEFNSPAIKIGGQYVPLFSALETIYGLVKAGKADEARDGLNAIASWHNSISEIAKQEDNPEVKKLREKIRADEQARSSEAEKSFHTSYRTEAEKTVSNDAESLINQWLGNRKLDRETRNLAKNNVISLANEMLLDGKTFPQYAKQRDLLFQRGDKAALLRYTTSVWKQAMEKSVLRVMRLVGGAPAAKPGVAGDKKPAANGQRPAAPAAGAGWVKVNERPSPLTIDRTKTTSNMIASEKRAVLKDGRKVSWAHL